MDGMRGRLLRLEYPGLTEVVLHDCHTNNLYYLQGFQLVDQEFETVETLVSVVAV
jgi:hypothetical protein